MNKWQILGNISFEGKKEKNMDFNESVTKINLARSFSAECQAGARYQFMSKMALSDNQKFLSDTMKTLAKNEMAHAKVFYDRDNNVQKAKCFARDRGNSNRNCNTIGE